MRQPFRHSRRGASPAPGPVPETGTPKNVVLLIGDSVGFEQVKAAGMYDHGAAGTLPFEAFPHRAEMTTRSADSFVTDSAAAATAIATARKVGNGIISVAHPGNGGELTTLLEYLAGRGRSTGLATMSNVAHATPAAFGAHAASREDLGRIVDDYLARTRLNVLFGGGSDEMPAGLAAEASYTVVTDRDGLRGTRSGKPRIPSVACSAVNTCRTSVTCWAGCPPPVGDGCDRSGHARW